MDCRYKGGIHPLVWRLIQPYQEIVGPRTFVMRLAFWSAVGDLPFDVDGVIAESAEYLDKPEHADERGRLVGTCRWIRDHTPKAPVWLLPEDGELSPKVWFDPSQWFTGLAAG